MKENDVSEMNDSEIEVNEVVVNEIEVGEIEINEVVVNEIEVGEIEIIEEVVNENQANEIQVNQEQENEIQTNEIDLTETQDTVARDLTAELLESEQAKSDKKNKKSKKVKLKSALNSIKNSTSKFKHKSSTMMKTFANSSDKSKRKKFNLSLAIFKGGYVYNPVLTQVLGVCPIVMLATTFLSSINLAVVVTLMLLVCEIITSKFLKRVERWVRVSIYAFMGAIVTIPIYLLMEKSGSLSTAFSIYLPLLSVNGMIVTRCEKFACKTTVKNSMFDAIATGVGFGAVALIVGTAREIFVNGSIFNINFANLEQLPSSSMAFITLVLLGFLSAIHKFSLMKYFPKEITDTFDLSQVFEKVSFSEDGIETKKNAQKNKANNNYKNYDMDSDQDFIDLNLISSKSELEEVQQ